MACGSTVDECLEQPLSSVCDAHLEILKTPACSTRTVMVSTASALHAAVENKHIACVLLASENFALTSSLLLRHNLSLIGLQERVQLSAAGLDTRPIQVAAGATVLMANVSVTGGIVNETLSPTAGGGILNHGILSLIDSHISSNSVTANTAFGGGLSNYGRLHMLRVVVEANAVTAKESAGGGGVYNLGEACIWDSYLIANSVTANQSVANGGGLFNDEDTTSIGACHVQRTLVQDNLVISIESFANGGGVVNGHHHNGVRHSSIAPLTLQDVTVSGNVVKGFSSQVTGGGGALFNFGSTLIRSSILIDNDVLLNYTHPGNGGGVYHDDGQMCLCQTRVEHNGGWCGGGFFISGQANFTMLDSYVARNYGAGWGGGGMYIRGSDTKVYVWRSIFQGNVAGSGGAITAGWNSPPDPSLDGPNLYLYDTHMLDNVASVNFISGQTWDGDGGGLYLGMGGFYTTVELNNVTIARNHGRNGGGLFINTGFALLQMGTRIFNNTAASNGSSVFNSANGLTYALPAPKGTYMPTAYLCAQIKSGTTYQQRQVCDWGRFSGKFLANLSVFADNDIPFPCAPGYFCPDGTQRHACESGIVSEDRRECLPCPEREVCAGGFLVCGAFSAPRASCGPGHWPTSIADCPCDSSFYRPNHSSMACSMCPVGADCMSCATHGCQTSTLRLKAGYWRMNLSTPDIRPCPVAHLCSGDVNSAEYGHYCAPGLDGSIPYCSRCLDYPASYFVASEARCDPCPTSGPLALILSCVLLALFVLVKMYSYIEQKDSSSVAAIGATDNHGIRARSLRARLIAFVTRVRRVQLKAKLKQTTCFYQIVTRLHEVYGVVLPSNFIVVSHSLKLFDLDLFHYTVRLQCLGLTSFFSQLLARALTPLVIIAIVAAYRWWRGRLADAVPFALWLTSLTFSFVSSPAFQAFACEKFDDGQWYMRADYAVICHDGDSITAEYRQIQALAIAVIVVYAIGVPASYALLLFSTRRTRLRNLLGFLTADYKQSFFYWELIEIFRKLLLASFFALPFMGPGTLLQLIGALSSQVAMLIILLNAQPFVHPSDGLFALIANTSLVFVFLCCMVLEQDVLILAVTGTLSPFLRERFELNAAAVGAVLIVSTVVVLIAVIIVFSYNAFIVPLPKADNTGTSQLRHPLINSSVSVQGPRLRLCETVESSPIEPAPDLEREAVSSTAQVSI